MNHILIRMPKDPTQNLCHLVSRLKSQPVLINRINRIQTQMQQLDLPHSLLELLDQLVLEPFDPHISRELLVEARVLLSDVSFELGFAVVKVSAVF